LEEDQAVQWSPQNEEELMLKMGRREKAALKIQSLQRGRRSRVDFNKRLDSRRDWEARERRDAALTLQALQRGRIGRAEGDRRIALQRQRQQKSKPVSEVERRRAAVKLQALQRGRKGRKDVRSRRLLYAELERDSTLGPNFKANLAKKPLHGVHKTPVIDGEARRLREEAERRAALLSEEEEEEVAYTEDEFEEDEYGEEGFEEEHMSQGSQEVMLHVAGSVSPGNKSMGGSSDHSQAMADHSVAEALRKERLAKEEAAAQKLLVEKVVSDALAKERASMALAAEEKRRAELEIARNLEPFTPSVGVEREAGDEVAAMRARQAERGLNSNNREFGKLAPSQSPPPAAPQRGKSNEPPKASPLPEPPVVKEAKDPTKPKGALSFAQRKLAEARRGEIGGGGGGESSLMDNMKQAMNGGGKRAPVGGLLDDDDDDKSSDSSDFPLAAPRLDMKIGSPERLGPGRRVQPGSSMEKSLSISPEPLQQVPAPRGRPRQLKSTEDDWSYGDSGISENNLASKETVVSSVYSNSQLEEEDMSPKHQTMLDVRSVVDYLKTMRAVQSLELTDEEWKGVEPLLTDSDGFMGASQLDEKDMERMLKQHQGVRARSKGKRLEETSEAAQDGGPISQVMKCLKDRLSDQGESLSSLYDRWDPYHSGEVDISDLCSNLQDIQSIHQLNFSRGQWRAIQKQLDLNGSSSISKPQLEEMMQKYAGRASSMSRARQQEEASKTNFSELMGAAYKELGGKAFGKAYLVWQHDGNHQGGSKVKSPSWMS